MSLVRFRSLIFRSGLVEFQINQFLGQSGVGQVDLESDGLYDPIYSMKELILEGGWD